MFTWGSHSYGKVIGSHGILNFYSRPGKVLEFRFLPNLVLEGG